MSSHNNKSVSCLLLALIQLCAFGLQSVTASSNAGVSSKASGAEPLSSSNYKDVLLDDYSSDDTRSNLMDFDDAQNSYATVKKEKFLEKSYHGLVRENETIVEITPLMKVDAHVVCGFRIIKNGHHEIPFQIELVKNFGMLKARRTLNCEKRKSYRFQIVAILCDGTLSTTANVHISVIDINEYAPIFLQPSYVTEVDEGRLYQEIIRVEAKDKDCSPLFGDVCKFEILNSDQPFTIDKEGSIRNTEPLSHTISHNHILSVVAYDCAMKQSVPVMVNIKVRRVCEARLIGIPERIDYAAGSLESLLLFPNLRMELCEVHCRNENLIIHASVVLKTKHISFGCDRDISLCRSGSTGMSQLSSTISMINLLPKGEDWTKNLSYDEGAEAVFHFDGQSGAIIPSNLVGRYDFASRPFTLTTSFRHFSAPNANKHTKEHIICSADDHKMNRHHMALFVRNCRLILLLRKNFNEGDLNIFSPAEWRWKISEVCDNEWHTYVLNVDLPKIELFVDGMKFEASAEDRHSNPEVIDDWPLHAAHGVNTTLTIGSCFQGSDNRLRHGFNGDVAEIRLLLDEILSADDIRCAANCAEHLLPPSEQLLESEQEVQYNSQLNEIYIEGTNRSNIELLLRKIQYINTKRTPTIGRRNIEVRTTMACPNQNSIRLPSIETYIMVSAPATVATNESADVASQLTAVAAASSTETPPPSVHFPNSLAGNDGEKPKIFVTGNSNHLVSYPDIKEGVRILANISIAVGTVGEGRGNLVTPANLQTLDACSVSVFPSLNPDHEEIALDGDESLSGALDIKTNINKDGVDMLGYDSIDNYLDVLRALVYTNKKPAYYLNRVFKLSCSQANGNFKSAEYTLTLTVLHPKLALINTTVKTPVAAVAASYSVASLAASGGISVTSDREHDTNVPFSHAMIHSHDVQEPKSRVHAIVHKAKSSHPTVLIIAICVFFIILLCGISIARLRSSNHKFMEAHQQCPKLTTDQLDWDDSALTITINPMQNEDVSEDSSVSENSDSDDEEVLNGKYKNVSQLEWDHSTM